jgi:hypothetical protein
VRDGVIRRGWLVAALGAACAHPGAESHASQDVARGCSIDLSGSWALEGNVGYRYEATDDGQRLRLIPRRVNADGTPVPEDATTEKVQMELRRSPGQFAGEFRMPEATGTGESCPLLLNAKLTACAADRIVLEIAQSYALNQGCLPTDLGTIASDEHVLVRVKN